MIKNIHNPNSMTYRIAKGRKSVISEALTELSYKFKGSYCHVTGMFFFEILVPRKDHPSLRSILHEL
jgi:hypothetical protein